MSWLASEEEVVWPMPASLVLDMMQKGQLDGERVELIDGRLLTVAPQGPEHWSCGRALRRVLVALYGADRVASQVPLLGAAQSIPEPDLAVFEPAFDDAAGELPAGADCVLVVEVAYSSHRRDRQKAEIYASIGVPEYWMVDLVARRIEVHRDPVDGARYRTVQLLSVDDSLAFPGTEHRQSIASLLGDAEPS